MKRLVKRITTEEWLEKDEENEDLDGHEEDDEELEDGEEEDEGARPGRRRSR